MNCTYCGTAVEDFAVFCPVCGKMVLPPKMTASPEVPAEETQEKSAKKTAQRIYPPRSDDAGEACFSESEIFLSLESEESGDTALHDQEPSIERKPPVPHKKAAKTNQRLVVLAVVFALIAAIAVGVAVYVGMNTHNLRVELTKAQTERASAQASVESLEKQVTELDTSLSEVKEERDALSLEAADLSTKVNSMESSVNQSAYDKESAERDLADAQEDIKALSQQITDIQTKLNETEDKLSETEAANEQLQLDCEAAEEKAKGYEDEVGFYDTYVVFVMLSSDTKYYHKYDCEDFTKRNFLAYSTKLAEANGYSPCPKCKH